MKIGTRTILAAALALAGCGGGGPVESEDPAAVIQKGTYTYDPDRRHAPVSLSGADLFGLEPRV